VVQAFDNLGGAKDQLCELDISQDAKLPAEIAPLAGSQQIVP
jgi:hypothetical protein